MAFEDSSAKDAAIPDAQQLDAPVADQHIKTDGGKALSIKGTIWVPPFISCGTTANRDCKGHLVIFAFQTSNPPVPSAAALSKVIKNVDLSNKKAVHYTLSGWTGPGAAYIGAFLSERALLSKPPWPQKDDLTRNKLMAVMINTAGPTVVNIPLDVRVNFP